MKAAKATGLTLILLAYRHGVRVSELVPLKWAQIDLKQGQFAVVRVKNGTPSTTSPAWTRNPHSQASQEGIRQSPYGFKLADDGHDMADDGHDTRAIQHYLGHKQIQHTVRYTELALGRFEGFWRD